MQEKVKLIINEQKEKVDTWNYTTEQQTKLQEN